MAGFISDLLAGLPVPGDEDFDVKDMLKGVREAMRRLNEELEFVQGLGVVREKVDAMEQSIAENATLGTAIQDQQMKINEKMVDNSLTIDGQASRTSSGGGPRAGAKCARRAAPEALGACSQLFYIGGCWHVRECCCCV